MKLNKSQIWTNLYQQGNIFPDDDIDKDDTIDLEINEEWNEYIKGYSLALPHFDNINDTLLYIQESNLLYTKTKKDYPHKGYDATYYCFKLDNTYIYIYYMLKGFGRMLDDQGNKVFIYKIIFDNVYYDEYL